MKKRTRDVVFDFADQVAEENVPYYKTAKTVYKTANALKRNYEDYINNQSDIQTNQMPSMKKMKSYRAVKYRPRRALRGRSVNSRIKNYSRTQNKGAEIKRVDLIQAAGTYQSLTAIISTTQQVYGLNIPQQGSADFQRTGSKVKGIAILLKGYIYNQMTSANGSKEDLARFVIVYDKFPNGVAPAWGNVFSAEDAGSVVTTTGTTLPKNNQTKDRFIILRDHSVLLASATAGGFASTAQTIAQPGSERLIEWYIPLKNLVTEYNANSGAVTDIDSGGIFLLIRSERNASADSTWVFTGTSRYTYVDN